jgi:antitoxin component YwqK of YwqJK toxin-antitoxin module
MRPAILFQTFLLITILGFSCTNEEKVVDHDTLVYRNNLWYEVNSERPFTGQGLGYYKDGFNKVDKEKVFSLSHYKKGKLYYRTYYHENGQKMSEVGVKDTSAHGDLKEWAENGQLLLEAKISMDSLHGEATYYYESSGQVKEKGIWGHGKRAGVWEYYFDNGQLWAKFEYHDGRLWNVIEHFNRDGSRIEGETLKDGNGIHFNYKQDGMINRVVSSNDGQEIDAICGSYTFNDGTRFIIMQGESLDDFSITFEGINYTTACKREEGGKIPFRIRGNNFYFVLANDWQKSLIENKKICIEMNRTTAPIQQIIYCRDLL